MATEDLATADRAVAIVGLGAILPDAPDVGAFWQNVLSLRSSIIEVPPDRWKAADYYSEDRKAPGKTYSRIGAWVRPYVSDHLKFRIPPKVAAAMDAGQMWALSATRQVLADVGYPDRPLDLNRTGVILGTALGGERHNETTLGVTFPVVLAEMLEHCPAVAELQPAVRAAIQKELAMAAAARLPVVTEDSMPGELANVVAGRVANVFDMHGPNFTTDAACASALAAADAAVEALISHECDAVVTGGVDRNMGPAVFVKFSKIGALSPDGSRPFAPGANGFVMGEGAALFALKRLADAERDGDKVYAVIRGIGASSDGKGKGITAPNPEGQLRALKRAYALAGLSPATVTLIEAHGTSTPVGDAAEVKALHELYAAERGARGIALGSVKSQIGHLKGAAGAAGMLKAVLATHHATLPPTANCEQPDPTLQLDRGPLFINSRPQHWERPPNGIRRAGVSSFGFGGTNYHMVIEEHLPGMLTRSRKSQGQVPAAIGSSGASSSFSRGLAVASGQDVQELVMGLQRLADQASAGRTPQRTQPNAQALLAPHRVVIDYGSAGELKARAEKALHAVQANRPELWKMLRSHGVCQGIDRPGKVAFLFPGQGSQYVNMLRELRDAFPLVRELFERADDVMFDRLNGRKLSSLIFGDAADPASVQAAEEALRHTTVTQPAMLTVDLALYKLLESFGCKPDMVMGHSLGEYAALVAAGVLSFEDALVAVSARAREMAKVTLDDPGKMASVMGPSDQIESVLQQVPGYVVAANRNSPKQTVVAGSSEAVAEATKRLTAQGHRVVQLPVSHAFHTEIVAPASEPLGKLLSKLTTHPPSMGVVANVTGDLYPCGSGAERAIVDSLTKQIASPVQFVRGLETLYQHGARVFVEVGPKRVLSFLVEDTLGQHGDIVAVATNQPKAGALPSFGAALAQLLAMREPPTERPAAAASVTAQPQAKREVLMDRSHPTTSSSAQPRSPVVISGASVGLPGTRHPVFDDGHVQRLLRGEQQIEPISDALRAQMVDKNIVRLVKRAEGSPEMQRIGSASEVVKLAARPGPFDLTAQFGVPQERASAYDSSTALAIGAGIEALRDAGVPLVRRYRKTTKGTFLPERWMLPEPLADETGIVFASAFPGLDAMIETLDRYRAHQIARAAVQMLERLQAVIKPQTVTGEFERLAQEVRAEAAAHSFELDRKFLFRILPMGHSQFAELIGARGPNAAVNSACASTAMAVAMAEDWIRAGRCARVIVISADNVTGDSSLPWFASGFLASGAAAVEGDVTKAALPFDKRRNGMILGMGACALVVESADSVRSRSMTPLAELLAADFANSAFHGTRLDVGHITQVVQRLMQQAETRYGIDRHEMAPRTVFVSHETYTPARGGSASAEVQALRDTFGPSASQVVIANAKGFTGHPMGVGIEDTLAIKALQYQTVPPIANFEQPDPELGELNLSRGGHYDVDYALRFAAGFGSQLAVTLYRRGALSDARIQSDEGYRGWLADMAGYPSASTEVTNRTLRICDAGPPTRKPVRTGWQFGTVPQQPITAAPAPAEEWDDESQDNEMTAGEFFAARVDEDVGEDVSQVDAEYEAPVEPAAAPAAEPASEAGPSMSEQDIAERIVQIVADKTGYPPDMLARDLDLEADLGIDTVKQAEVFGEIRQAFNIPRRDDLRLRDYPTIDHVIGFVQQAQAGAQASQQEEPATAPSPITPAEAATEPVVESQSAQETKQAPSAAAKDPKEEILAIVAEKTGYPADMLALDLDLEADLGIDTVKQADIFATIREHFGIPRDASLSLRDYPTLEHVVRFVSERRGRAEPATPVAPAPEAAPVVTQARAAAERPKTEPAGPTRYRPRVPYPLVRPSLEMCKPTGCSLRGANVIVIGDRGAVGTELCRALRNAGAHVLLLRKVISPDTVRQFAAQGPVSGVIFLRSLDADEAWEEACATSFAASMHEGVRTLFTVLQPLARALTGSGTFLACATRFGGTFGYGSVPAYNPCGGAVSGFAKAFGRESPACLVKVVDFETTTGPAAIAQVLIDEILRDPGAVEVGYHNGHRYGLTLLEEDPSTEQVQSLGQDAVVLVTGAGGAITSAITADLARASRGTFHLLDLPSEPDASNPDLRRVREDREGLKRDLVARMRAVQPRVTPASIERELLDIEHQAAVLRAIEAVREAGGRAIYHACNVTDEAAVRAIVQEAAAPRGRIDVIVHAAGLERSRTLESKSLEEFNRIFDVKAAGLFHLLASTRHIPVGALVCFSSIAGRFGNAGQVDYSAANDLMTKVMSWLRRSRPDCRAVALDWSAWGQIGMAARGSIPEIMSRAGIEMLEPAEAIPLVRRAIERQWQGEVLVAGELGTLTEPVDPEGGLDRSRVGPMQAAHEPFAMQMLRADPLEGVVWQATLDPKQPYLRDHRIDGVPVLPGVMGIEMFARAVRMLAQTWSVSGAARVRFEAPVKCYRNEPRNVTIRTKLVEGSHGRRVVCELYAHLLTAPGPREKRCFQAELWMNRTSEAPQANAGLPEPPTALSPDDIYQVFFHGPSFQVLEAVWRAPGNQVVIGKMAARLPDAVQQGTMVSAPRLLELCLQTAGLVEIAITGRMGLPASIESLRLYPGADESGDRYAVVQTRREQGGQLVFDAQVQTKEGATLLQMNGSRTSQLPEPLEPTRAEPIAAALR